MVSEEVLCREVGSLPLVHFLWVEWFLDALLLSILDVVDSLQGRVILVQLMGTEAKLFSLDSVLLLSLHFSSLLLLNLELIFNDLLFDFILIFLKFNPTSLGVLNSLGLGFS